MKQPDLNSPVLDSRRSNIITIPSTDFSIGAQSDESFSVKKLEYQAFLHYYIPISRLDEESARRFYALKARWENDVRLISDTNEICTHEAYQKIIGMGEKALPFWAPKAITCEDPVPKELRGNLQLMAEAWLKWLDARQSRWAYMEQYQQFPMLVGRDRESRSAFYFWATSLAESKGVEDE